MFMQQSESVPGQMDHEFSRPVESIMRCEDFKSNFARRLSNRYISRAPVTANVKRQSSLKIRSSDCEVSDNAPERIKSCSQLSKVRITEQNGNVVRPPGKQMKNNNLRDTEVSALNMEIETIRWQLGQTKANRQMHIALLKQIVTFLSRVKDHIECQNPEAGPYEETITERESSASFNIADLPRSRSVFHVNRNADFSLTTSNKLSSKSISNVNSYKHCNGVWNHLKKNVPSDMENAHKITEEISRLITLANSVLSTKLPDLTCKCSDNTLKDESICNEDLEQIESNHSLELIDEDTTNALILNTIYDGEDTFDGVTNKLINVKDKTLTGFVMSSLPLACGLENDLAGVEIKNKNEMIPTQLECSNKMEIDDKKNRYNQVTHFIEDESGFSSMSSFQEIGIPIISIIPPSPCKEVGYLEELTNILDESEKWKNDTIDLDKQTVKVFWV